MQDLVNQLAKQVQNKYFGKFRGFVVDNADPEHRARLRLKVPSVLGEEITAWALPCLPFGGIADQGLFTVPEIGAQIWLEFEEGNISLPVWTGTFWQQDGDAPAQLDADAPDRRVLKTPSGHMLEFIDTDDEETINLLHAQGSQIELDKLGSIAITDANGAQLRLDADADEIVVEDNNGNILTMTSSGTTVEDSNGNKVSMAASGITLEGQQIVLNGSQVMLAGTGGEPIIKGQSFMSLFMTHIHPTGMGPSGPPIPQGEMSSLSTKVMTS